MTAIDPERLLAVVVDALGRQPVKAQEEAWEAIQAGELVVYGKDERGYCMLVARDTPFARVHYSCICGSETPGWN